MRREIAVWLRPDVQLLDVTGPLEVFSTATRLCDATGRRGGYLLRTHSPGGRPIRTAAGLELKADADHRSLLRRRSARATLLVPGRSSDPDTPPEPLLMKCLRRWPGRVASICAASWRLAEAGLLDGRRATTHWLIAERMREAFPRTLVEADALWVHDSGVWTSAGVSAGIDLALAMVQEDLGHELALDVARLLVLYMKRPGGQSQFSAVLNHQRSEQPKFHRLLAYIREHPDADLRVEILARKVHMSPRNFARAFARDIGATPAKVVAQIRLEAARRMLEDELQASIGEIALRSGHGSLESLRRRFAEHLGITPSAYRSRFGRAHAPTSSVA